MTTSDDSIVAFIKEVRAQDRRADRERIAELERDAAHLRTEIEQLCRHIKLVETDFAASLEKCAALVVERDSLEQARTDLLNEVGKRAGVIVALENELRESRRALAEEFKAGQRAKPEAPTLRIDTDMSDPQPGKLLVVRLDESDAYDVRGSYTFEVDPHQFVGFLVETPAVDVKRTPKVGDKVRAKMSGRIGVVHKLFGGVALINQGGQMFEVLASEIEVIE